MEYNELLKALRCDGNNIGQGSDGCTNKKCRYRDPDSACNIVSERVFCKDKKDFCDCIESCRKCQFAKGNGVISGYIAHDLLATLFGNDYDLSRLRELAQADRQGRCVVLSEPMSPMVQILGDTDVYCPNCAQTLSGGWPLSDAGDYRKMCQCPHCGQSIDDTKCAVCENEKK